MTPKQLDNWFTFHAPTAETRPRYAAVRAAEKACHELGMSLTMAEYTADTSDYARINATLRAFAEVIDVNAPDGDDKDAAIRCVRLARNCFNEQVASCLLGFPVILNMVSEGARQVALARFLANSAIACGGK